MFTFRIVCRKVKEPELLRAIGFSILPFPDDCFVILSQPHAGISAFNCVKSFCGRFVEDIVSFEVIFGDFITDWRYGKKD